MVSMFVYSYVEIYIKSVQSSFIVTIRIFDFHILRLFLYGELAFLLAEYYVFRKLLFQCKKHWCPLPQNIRHCYCEAHTDAIQQHFSATVTTTVYVLNGAECQYSTPMFWTVGKRMATAANQRSFSPSGGRRESGLGCSS